MPTDMKERERKPTRTRNASGRMVGLTYSRGNVMAYINKRKGDLPFIQVYSPDGRRLAVIPVTYETRRRLRIYLDELDRGDPSPKQRDE